MSENNENLIHFKGNQYDQYFDSRDELASFLNEEISYWRWIRSTLGNAGGQIYQTYISAPIVTILNQHQANPQINLKNYLSSKSPDALFIEATRKQHGDTIGLLTFIYLHPDKTTITRNNNVKQALSSSEHFYEICLAAYISATYRGELGSTTSIAEASISETINGITEHSNNAREIINNITCSHESELASLKNDRKNLLLRWNKQIKKRINLYGKVAKSLRSSAASQFASAKSDVEAAKEAYHDTIDFKASVTYWTERKTSHVRGKYGWLAALAAIMIATGYGLSSYYSHGGIIGIFSQAPVPPNTELGIDQADKKIVNLTGAGLIITFFWIFLRIALKQFNTHANLAIEASERVTMTKTYLALLGEGKLNGEQDRKLVLEALFKPSQLTSPISDSASTPVELIIKAITEKRG